MMVVLNNSTSDLLKEKAYTMEAAGIHYLLEIEKSKPRHLDPRRLTYHGRRVYSQNDEDGIIAEIFSRIGVLNKTFVEFGVETGVECNSTWLLMQGWSGLWIEANEASCLQMRESHKAWIENQSLAIINSFITSDNINELISQRYCDSDIDLLSIDLDFNDYWIWQAIRTVRPRVVVIEYNASWPPPSRITVPYDPSGKWDGTNYFGASIGAMAHLGEQKGYDLVGCSISGVNAFFVRNDLTAGRFLAPGSIEEHYEPPRYYFASMPAGHPPRIGPIIQIDQ